MSQTLERNTICDVMCCHTNLKSVY